jgi:hypothetical protein
MRLDHVSYVASHDQISDVVNRIGSQIGTAFIDGGIHPKFGTRNFTAPLLNGQYIEVVCPLDHPATDATAFGKLVQKSLQNGGGWTTWVLAVNEIEKIELRLGRKSIEGVRKKPNGTTLFWKQIGVADSYEDNQLPFFVEWISENHPSISTEAQANISEIVIQGNRNKIIDWVGEDYSNSKEFELLSITPGESSQISSVKFIVNGTDVEIL